MPTGGGLVTQFDKNDVEDAGLVKFDFLGLRTLTIIDWAMKIINGIRACGRGSARHQPHPPGRRATFDLLKSAETTAVFQLESRGMKELIARLRPDCFEDIIALVALFRPGRCSRAWSIISSTASTAARRSPTRIRVPAPVARADPGPPTASSSTRSR
jgi:DNA polymerase III alpha subunit